ncbi:hypothetical protein [Burkholderia ambifaria]|uniref:hypothetical protein n=1 Tax=Burkholderia ambifaria TaxID=152480 RepID=UPI00158B0B76|nr:hypothetical protein [Burkholderia ambifaria]
MIDIEKMKALAEKCREPASSWDVSSTLGDAATAIDTLLSELEAAKRENSDMMKALAECRDAMPMEYDSPHLGGAVGDPLEVPLFVKDIVARMRAELEAREADRRDAERYRWLRDKANFAKGWAPMVFNCEPGHEISWQSALHDGWLDDAIDAVRTPASEGEQK